MRKIILALLLLVLVPTAAHANVFNDVYNFFHPAPILGDGNIRPLDPWVATTSPIAALTQRSFGKPLLITATTTNATSTFQGSVNVLGNLQAARIIAPIVSSVSGTVTITGTGNCLTADSPTLVVDCTNHRVGLGLSNPSTKLEINGTASSTIFMGSNGTVNIPSFAFSGNTDAGFYYSSALNAINVGIDGTNEAVFRAGIGLYASGYGITNVSDPIAGGINLLNARIAGSSGVSYFNAGNVGIGTTTPGAKLDILAGTSLGLRIASTDQTSHALDINNNTFGFGTAKSFYIYQSGSGIAYLGNNNGNALAISSTQGVGVNTTSGPVGSNTKFQVNENSTNVNAASVMLNTGATTNIGLVVQGVSSQSADLQQWQNNSGTVLANITAAGNFGVGTVSPLGNFDVRQKNNGDTVFYAQRQAAGSGTGYFANFKTSNAGTTLFAVDTTAAVTMGKVRIDSSQGSGSLGYSTIIDAGDQTTALNVDGYKFQQYTTTGGTVNPFSILFKRDNANLAGYSALLVNATEDTTGTAANYLINLQRNSSSVMVVQSGGNVGIGTTSPYAKLSIQTGASTGDAFAVATTTGKAVFGIDNDGHEWTSGPTGTVSSCGTGSPTVAGDDINFVLTTGIAASSCTYTPAKNYRVAPSCIAGGNSTVGFPSVTSTAVNSIVIGISSALTGGIITVHCVYHQ